MKNKKTQTSDFKKEPVFLNPTKVALSKDGTRVLIYLGPLNIISLHRNFLNAVIANSMKQEADNA